MKVLLVSVACEFPLAAYCLGAQLAVSPETAECEVELLTLDGVRLGGAGGGDREVWRYLTRLDAFRPDLVGFSVAPWNRRAVRELITITATLEPRVAVIVGGPELATAGAAERWIDGGRVWAAVRGEGEETLVEIVGRLGRSDRDDRNGALAGVAGCTWWDGRSVVHEAPRPPAAEGTLRVSPYLSGRVPEDAFDRAVTRPGDRPGPYSCALVEVNRVRPAACDARQVGGVAPARRPVPTDRVLGEITWLLERDVAALRLLDDELGRDRPRTEELLRHVIDERQRLGAATAVFCRPDQEVCDPDLLDLYREAGVLAEVGLRRTSRRIPPGDGAGGWDTDRFDRHLTALRHHRVQTAGTVTLALGAPGDPATDDPATVDLATVETTADFLLRRQIPVRLDLGSWALGVAGRDLDQESASTAEPSTGPVRESPSSVLHDRVAARWLSEGVDLFRRFPRTARLLWRLGFEQPVDLCRRFGELARDRGEPRPGEEDEAILRELVDALCASDGARPVVHDLLRLEQASLRVAPPDDGLPTGRPVLEAFAGPLPDDRRWLDSRPRYRRESVAEAPIAHRVDRVLAWLSGEEPLPALNTWHELRSEPLVALVYREAPHRVSFRLVDAAFTHALLERFTGHFTVRECLGNLAGTSWQGTDLEPLWKSLASLSRAGFIEPGVAAKEEPVDGKE